MINLIKRFINWIDDFFASVFDDEIWLEPEDDDDDDEDD